MYSLSSSFAIFAGRCRPYVLCCLTAVCCLAGPATALSAASVSRGSYLSEEVRIPYERFTPEGGGRFPTILLLPGEEGLPAPNGRERCTMAAQALARHGYLVYLVHYLARTQTRQVDMISMMRYFTTWAKVIQDGITFAVTRPDTDPTHIGILGFSLGASEALAAGTQDSRISAIVEESGSLPDGAAGGMNRMPPTLILHGETDSVVSVREAHKLENTLKRKSVPYEIKLYPGQGHGFTEEAETDAFARTTRFFDAWLRPAPRKQAHELKG